jgi:putative ATP-binding cassette transporter
MHILRLLNTGTATGFRRILVVTCLAGLANAGVLGMINQAAEQTALDQPIGTDVLLLYICLAIFFFLADRASLREANRLVQHKLQSLRLRIVGKIRSVDLRTLENLGHGEIFATIAQEINHLSQTLPLLVSAAQSAFLLVFCLLYIAILSFWAFLVIGGFIALGLAVFWWRRLSLDQALAQIHGQEAEMLDNLAHFTKGFQEIRLNADKNDALFARFTQVVDDLQTQVVGIGRKWVVLLQFSNAFLYALVGVVIFILPLFFQGYTDVIYKITAAAIFCVGPVTAITAAAPLYAKADLGLGHVARLERRLSQGRMTAPRVLTGSAFSGFSTIACHGLHFAYRDETGEAVFTAGPFDLTLQRGETVFLVGGNGSGKSTAMKLMSGLYPAKQGVIRVDGDVVAGRAIAGFRELFSAIFVDFHLFDRLYGLENIDPLTVNRLIDEMGLAGKVRFENGRFTRLHLSTGQRKRLALIAALLEDRPIYLFDEWSAEQDIHFRKTFYETILPNLRKKGKLVIAVTHDERYWHLADRVVKLDLGSIVWDRPGEHWSAP